MIKMLPPAHEIPKIIESLIDRYEDVEATHENHVRILSIVRQQLGATSVVSEQREFEQFYFRARMGNFDITDPFQFSIPPARFTGSGRCNLPQSPVFYGGEHPATTLLEIGAKKGDKAYLSVWRSGSNYPKYAIFGYTDEVVTTPRLGTHAQMRLMLLRQSLSLKQPAQVVESLVAIQKGMATLFTSETWAISAALSHYAIFDSGLDGVEYPDAKNKTTYNFALNPCFAGKLELHRVWECKASGSMQEIEYCRIGSPCDGKVKWRCIQSDTDLPGKDPELPYAKLIGDDWSTR